MLNISMIIDIICIVCILNGVESMGKNFGFQVCMKRDILMILSGTHCNRLENDILGILTKFHLYGCYHWRV